VDDVVPLVGASAVALAWIPVLVRFVRSWRARSNPVSLAICALVGFAIYVPVYIASVPLPAWTLATVIAINVIACLTFYIAFWYARRTFSDTRKNGA
jgi:hypothetical protein